MEILFQISTNGHETLDGEKPLDSSELAIPSIADTFRASDASEGDIQTRVVIAADTQLLVDSLERALNFEADMEVVGTATTKGRAVSLANDQIPDAVVLGYSLSDALGTSVAKEIRDKREVPLVFIGNSPTIREVYEASIVGANAFFSTKFPLMDIICGIRRVVRGERTLIPPTTLIQLLSYKASLERRMRDEKQLGQASPNSLTSREREILALMASGLDNHAMADHLVIAYTTVRSHVQNVLEKLGAHSGLEAVAKANKHGLLSRENGKNGQA